MASKKPSGLGRGLGALLGDDVLKAETTGSLYLPIAQVESCSSQPRKHFDEAALAELADSIREHGIIRLLSDHRRRAPLAGSPPGRAAGGPCHRHGGRRPQGG